MSLPDYDQAMAASRDEIPFSNSTEGEAWLSNNCERCLNDKPAREGRYEDGCVLILVALEGRTPVEWTPDKPMSLGEQYRCMYFRGEDDGPDPEPAPIPDPPGQLTLVPREPYEQPARMLTISPQPAVGATS